jgi:DNA-binding response OmpR family regulator
LPGELILVVEDEPTLRDTVQYNLEKQGFAVEVAADGLQAIKKARELHPAVVILDLMLPRLDGLQVCRILRSEMKLPIIMVTARTDEIDRVVGLEMGADDYVTKPFSMRELIARVKAQLRRVEMMTTEGVSATGAVGQRLVFGDLAIDTARAEVTRDGDVLELKPREYELLSFLAKNKGRVLSRGQILEHVWGWEYSGGSRTVDVHVRWLRAKIEQDPSNPRRIVTVRGIGYRFEG